MKCIEQFKKPKSTIRAAQYWQTEWQKDFALKNGISQDKSSLSLDICLVLMVLW